MSYHEIQEYVKQARLKGYDNNTIRTDLLAAGWRNSDIADAFRELDNLIIPTPPYTYNSPEASQPTAVKQPVVKENLWDAFEHILMFISMYVLVFSLSMLFHYFVDRYLPGIEDPYNSFNGREQQARGYLAALIVSTPIFIYLFLRIASRTKKNPLLRKLISRRILTYLTLVGTFLFMLFSSITAIYSMLDGNVTLNFFLHFLITTGVSALVFAHYLVEVKEDRAING